MNYTAETAPAPPVARVDPHAETRHGEIVRDDYYWLRQKTDPEVIRYLEAENAFTEAMTAGLEPLVHYLRSGAAEEKDRHDSERRIHLFHL